jgi:DNA polymerase I-like protein with 3'-5' exonuclease and polymerase domains
MDLVCCSLKVKDKVFNYWLQTPEEKQRLKTHLLDLRSHGYVLVCFNAVAEARAIMSLGIDIRKFKWIDIQAEYKMMLNHNHKFEYGKQYIDGVYKTTTPPKNKYSMTEDDKMRADASKPQRNLLACTYKLLGVEVDKKYKDKMRDLILTKDWDLINKNKQEILDYCSGDIEELIELWSKIKDFYRDFFSRKPEEVLMSEVYWRGETVARTGIMEREGYPINRKKLTNLSLNAPKIMKEIMEDINSQFDWEVFGEAKNKIGYKQNQKDWREFISKSEYADNWRMTDPSSRHPKGQLSLSLNAFTDKFSYRHDYPRGNFYAQAIRFLKTKQTLNGLTPSASSVAKKETIFDNIGSDGRVRAFLNPYGSQSARYQPAAKSFMFLKPSWTRGIVEPNKGKAIIGIDYKSEEALIGALNSNDLAMIEAYKSGDVYFDYAKRAGAVPHDGIRSDYEDIRDLFKSTYLGISYLMGPVALAKKLTADTGKIYTKEDAQKLIKLFYEAYPVYKQYLDDVAYTYEVRGYMKLSDGWTMFGDNDNYRSYSNYPIQGAGSVILRKAIELAQDAGLKIVFPLHDALYAETEAFDYKAIDTLAMCMEKAFKETYPDNPNAHLIRLDIDTWSPDYEEGSMSTEQDRYVNVKREYIDPRGKIEYEMYKKYM